MEMLFHEKIVSFDLKMMRVKIGNDSLYDDLIRLVFQRLNLLKPDTVEKFSEPCEFQPLIGWRKHRFHAGIDQEPDMRIIFRYMDEKIQILAIGFRNYIYKEAERRDQRQIK